MPIHVKLAGGWGAKWRIRQLEEKAEARRRSTRLARAQADERAERADRTAELVDAIFAELDPEDRGYVPTCMLAARLQEDGWLGGLGGTPSACVAAPVAL